MLSAQNPMLSAKNPMLSANSDVGPPMSTDRYQTDVRSFRPRTSLLLRATLEAGKDARIQIRLKRQIRIRLGLQIRIRLRRQIRLGSPTENRRAALFHSPRYQSSLLPFLFGTTNGAHSEWRFSPAYETEWGFSPASGT